MMIIDPRASIMIAAVNVGNIPPNVTPVAARRVSSEYAMIPNVNLTLDAIWFYYPIRGIVIIYLSNNIYAYKT